MFAAKCSLFVALVSVCAAAPAVEHETAAQQLRPSATPPRRQFLLQPTPQLPVVPLRPSDVPSPSAAPRPSLAPLPILPSLRPRPSLVPLPSLAPLPGVGSLAPVAPPQINPGDQFFDKTPEGRFSSGFRSADGTQVYMEGELVPTTDGKDVVVVKRGAYSYITPEGNTISVRYVADHLGFRVIPGDQRV
ncbi:Hypothetical predicted protein [Cloeon dipterum]|uniref:Uncharacterized protein n=1 Tax=Cloeon dipterum TaxID=197152 RepID=A0A8S1D295_9INSE|nr:Hypothetical predicted protein [Cloeon dipterum]